MTGKKLVLGLLLLVVLSLPSFSDVVLTQEQYDTIQTALANSKKELKIANDLLILSDQDSTTSNEIIQLLKNEIVILKSTITMLQTTLNLLNKSYEMQKMEKFLNDLGWFTAGSLAGFVAGNYTSIKIGVTIPIQ